MMIASYCFGVGIDLPRSSTETHAMIRGFF
jgi:hypothetical protein